MPDFETFKASRLRLDPSSKKLSDRQWDEAYAAHIKSRERVGRRAESRSRRKEASRQRKEARGSGQKGAPVRTEQRALHAMRAHSAYGELRLLVDMLAWFAWAIIGFSLIVKLLIYTATPAILLAFLGAGLQALAVFAFKILFKVAADAADFAREKDRSSRESAQREEGTGD